TGTLLKQASPEISLSATDRSHRILPMGLGYVFLNDLIELKQKSALDGATGVMKIGAQQISDSLMIAPSLPEACRLFGCTPPPILTPVGTENFTKSAPSSAP